jgi:hypothetical protein
MVTGETATETPREEAEGAETSTRSAATPVAVWIVYALGLLAAFVFVVSLAVVGVAYATTGDGGFGLDVSITAFVIWLLLAVAAAVTFIWRRFGAGR